MNAKEQVEIELEVDPGVVPGTSLQIVKYPSPILRAENALVTEFDRELVELTKQMFKVMYASRGVGLAAPQVGVNKRVMVFNPKGDAAAWLSEVALVNPRIVEQSGKTELGDEACLSFPGMGGKVDRSVWIKVEAQKPNGKKFKVKYTGWEAIVFQHEYDHLEGVLYIDRLSEPERERVQPRLDELIAEFDGTPAL
ncbi:Peptide deformylase 1B, chloroplastic [Porphyridium purpureum]|uniref:Peptide deformylase n=1 Tax=Porphyridium purpureum TaxID=35688 RepID=A0A5J4YYA4_PORPP|nr:Peptide deformylase 1B, chloroplastic [Porphyridium purpureum]|eukprot:POR4292..scf209_3